MNVRKLKALPTSRLRPLLLESEHEGFRFARQLQGDIEGGTARFEEAGEALFGAFRRRTLVGVCALSRDPYVDSYGTEVCDRLRLGRVRHLYVLRAYRRQGVGKGLLKELLLEAPEHYDALTLRTDTASAAAFYDALGFRRVSWPNTTHLLPLRYAV